MGWIMGISYGEITEHEISANSLMKFIRAEKYGAIVSFSGDVRNHDQGKGVLKLVYEIHPTAQRILDELIDEILRRYADIEICAAHRYGEIPIGESAFVVVVASAHRNDAFRACAEFVDLAKSKLPIWKHQYFSDGTEEWVNNA